MDTLQLKLFHLAIDLRRMFLLRTRLSSGCASVCSPNPSTSSSVNKPTNQMTGKFVGVVVLPKQILRRRMFSYLDNEANTR